MKRIIIAAIIAGGIVTGTTGCTEYDEATGQDCIILANGGNKLCGDDAKAWCETTDEIRDLSDDSKSQAVCDDIRGK